MGRLFLALLLLCGTAHGGPSAEAPFRVETMGDGVWLFRPGAENPQKTNSVVVERDDGLFVIDAQATPADAEALLKAIAARFDRPVRYLAISHPHAESAGGASAFPPLTIVFASSGCAAALTDQSFDFGAEIRAAAENPDSWTEPPRPRPTVVIEGTITLPDNRNPIVLLRAGKGHAPGDLFVRIPEAEVLYLGGLPFHDERNPYARDGSVDRWAGLLDSARREAPKLVVGVRGPAVRANELATQRDALAWLKFRVEEAWIEGIPPEEMTEHLLALPGMADRFGVEATPSHVPELIDRAVAESVEHRRKRGAL